MINTSRECRFCGKVFTKPQNCSLKNWENSRKSCSRECGNKSKKTPWLVKHQIKKGEHLGKSTQFKKGQTSGSSNNKWKGNEASYTAKHMWVKYHFGSPQECEHCGTTEKRMYHWANISKKYLREREDWLRLCVPCHKKYDLTRI